MNILKRPFIIVMLGFLILTLLVFREVIPPSALLNTTDDNVGSIAFRKNILPQAWFGAWNDLELLGQSSMMPINGTNMLMALLPARFFNDWINAFDLLVGSLFLTLFLRRRGLDWAPSVLGALTGYWLASNFTLVYAGHIGKFGILMWSAIYLWLADHMLEKKSWPLSILTGGALGMLFLEQPDVGLFFALVLGPYVFFRLLHAHRDNLPMLARLLLPLLLVSFLLAVHPLLGGYRTAVVGVATMEETSEDKWNFVTQWSWPPEETIDFIAPGYTGWRSGEPAGPYVGRMGRSPDWDETKQGFPNFKLENQYIGAIPVMMALFAIVLAWKRRRDGMSPEVLFWAAAACFTLLLAFGKYFFLYRIFYMLPMVSSIRNPNKFLQIFQLAFAILAAYGLHGALRIMRDEANRAVEPWMRHVTMVPAALGAIFVLWTLGSMGAWDAITSRYMQAGWPHAQAIAGTRIWSLGHASVMLLVAAAALYGMVWKRWRHAHAGLTVSFVLLAFVVFDVFFLGKHYVKTMPAEALASSPVIQLLQSEPHQRTALVMQSDFYNHWMTYLFPYHNIKTINITQMPRMPEDYSRYLDHMNRNPIHHWRLGGVEFLLGPVDLWSQVQNDPNLKDQFELVYAYNMDTADGALRVIPATREQPGRHVVLRMKDPSPRYTVLGAWQTMEDQVTLNRLASPGRPLFEEVLIAPGQETNGIPATGGNKGEVGTVVVKSYRPGHVRLSVSAREPGIVRLAEKFDPGWKATVSGVPVPLLRVDYIAQGVYVTPGRHDVELVYRSPMDTLYIQLATFVLILFAKIKVWSDSRRTRKESDRHAG
jgi:hypothetical protein